jgi:hypothetical protein
MKWIKEEKKEKVIGRKKKKRDLRSKKAEVIAMMEKECR